ncbi:hypothetical protein QBC32DRAFT_389798 [Pseudoneurospora amorphoporcata]|uniref:Uncharacterized protein n=1 Tax=Pseudoneurospora amorphoporcata TaxID=241081 RepID=A0AAN6SAL4_9PEZI|nr:hypothetical protein QBC32DRAFT_389798 [Pseudoneurospora amorphoporcata]
MSDKPRVKAGLKVTLNKSHEFSKDLLIIIGQYVSLGTKKGKLLGAYPHAVTVVDDGTNINPPARTKSKRKGKQSTKTKSTKTKSAAAAAADAKKPDDADDDTDDDADDDVDDDVDDDIDDVS